MSDPWKDMLMPDTTLPGDTCLVCKQALRREGVLVVKDQDTDEWAHVACLFEHYHEARVQDEPLFEDTWYTLLKPGSRKMVLTNGGIWFDERFKEMLTRPVIQTLIREERYAEFAIKLLEVMK